MTVQTLQCNNRISEMVRDYSPRHKILVLLILGLYPASILTFSKKQKKNGLYCESQALNGVIFTYSFLNIH